MYWWRMGGDSCLVSTQALAGEELGSLDFKLRGGCDCYLKQVIIACA